MTRIAWMAVALGMGWLAWPVHASDDIVQRRVAWPDTPDAAHVSVRDVIKGGRTVDHVLRARQGQKLVVQLRAGHPSTYFNVMKTGAPDAFFIGSTSGARCEWVLTESADYTVRVYLMRSAARRGAQSRYVLDLSLSEPAGDGTPPMPEAKAFDRHLSFQGIGFHVRSWPVGEGRSQVSITPSGLSIDNTPMQATLPGAVRDAEPADLNADGSPEVYVYLRDQVGEHLLAYASNRRKSLSQINLPEMTSDMKVGYRGRDEFAVVENRLARRFPLFTSADPGAAQSGRMRQVQYRLVPAEASWGLLPDRVFEY